MEYRDYEESGFYSYKKNISTGTIFTQRPTEFSSDGIFKSLYNKLAIMKALQPEKKEVESLDALWGRVMVLKDVDKMVTAFTDFAKARGYTQKQIDSFLSEVI